MKKFLLLVLFIGFTSIYSSYSQNTGAFDEYINFNGLSRKISFYVPTDYDPSKTYNLLIGLHGLGDNSTNFRNALINILSWDLIFTNTILVFPDGGDDQIKDFYTPEGDEQIIIETINYCKENYNIDESNIILEGFSLGGRSALKFALDNPDMFKGVILNTPAIQGKMDAMNEPALNFGFNYKNASKVKIAISYGTRDLAYVAPIRAMFDSLTHNNGIAFLQPVVGMQHNVAQREFIEELRDFIENPTPENDKIELLNIDYRHANCNSAVNLKFDFRNSGKNNISKVKAIVTDGNKSFEKEFDTDLASFKFAESDIDFNLSSDSINKMTLYLYSMDGANTVVYDSVNFDIWYYPDGVNTPFLEDFESEEILTEDWEIIHGASPFPFFPDDGYNSENSLLIFNTILLFYNMNTAEELITPPLNIKNLSMPTLYFDYSYNYHLYTPPYFKENTIFTDTLEILVSTDCGDNWVSVSKKWGDELSTYPEPILNPLQLDQIVPENKIWKKEVIDLSDFQDSEFLKIKFSYISGLGGAFNIDNISIDKFTSVYESNSQLSLYPNPANDFVIINFGNSGFNQIELINSLGQIVRKNSLEDTNVTYRLDVSDLPSGFYTIRLLKNDKFTTLRFVKN